MIREPLSFLKSRCWSVWAEKRGLEHLSHFIIDKETDALLGTTTSCEVPSLAIRVRGTHQLTLPPKLDFDDPYPYDLVVCSRRSYSLLSCFSEDYFYALNIYACLKKERGLGGAAVSLVPALSKQRQVNLSEYAVSLIYIVRPCHKKTTNKNSQHRPSIPELYWHLGVFSVVKTTLLSSAVVTVWGYKQAAAGHCCWCL